MSVKKVYELKNAKDFIKNKDYVEELKFDGQRRKLVNDNGNYYMTNKQDEIRKIPKELLDELHLKFDSEVKSSNPLYNKWILDGELVFIDPITGSNHRTQAQNKKAELTYMVFDILELGDENLRNKDINGNDWTWLKRRIELEGLCEFAEWNLKDDNVVQLVEFVSTTEYKEKLLKYAFDNNLEGVILKNINATYDSKCKTDMIKIKFTKTDDYIVIGYTEAEGTKTGKREKYFGSLVLAQYDKNGNLLNKGKCGGGYTDKDLIEISNKLDKKNSITLSKDEVNMEIKNLNDKSYNETYGNIHWLPKSSWFVIEIKMMNLTEKYIPFLPRFMCIRDDKLVTECIYEK